MAAVVMFVIIVDFREDWTNSAKVRRFGTGFSDVQIGNSGRCGGMMQRGIHLLHSALV